MCGLVAVISLGDDPVSVDDAGARRLLVPIAHRGPDDEAVWSDGRATIAHRRLAVRGRAENRQPLALAPPHAAHEIVLSYNGEIYNTEELRVRLEREGFAPRSGTDTELLALALAAWGTAALPRLRGMFGLVAYCPTRNEVIVARDALGVIPIYYAVVSAGAARECIVASEPTAILAHQDMRAEPDWASVGNYLTTLRLTAGGRTLFRDISALEPGCALTLRLGGATAPVTPTEWWRPGTVTPIAADEAAALVRSTVIESVEAHLVADESVCTMLSGGLDSSIITAIARERIPGLRTFCAGDGFQSSNSDLDAAREVAGLLQTDHHEVVIDEARFAARWPWMIDRLGVPLSTPNELAIHAVAEAMRPFTRATLSGEGADELFAGYEPALEESERWISAGARGSVESWHATTFGWIPPAHLPQLLAPAILVAARGEQLTLNHIRACFGREGDPRDLRTHLAVQRRLNLTSLLGRLNTAAMLAWVEGRVPFADVRVAEVAARLPLDCLLAPTASASGTSIAVATVPRTKRVLREAFADLVPSRALVRPKASFPLPFERWLSSALPLVQSSSAVRLALAPAALDLLRDDLSHHWRTAWPLLNIGLWLRRWWG